jgi:hypothetical protein
MKKRTALGIGVLGVGALVMVALLGVLGYAVYLVRSINTPEFKKTVLKRTASTIGTDVQVKEMKVSLLSGVTLSGVAVANPKPFKGALLTADSFVLRYRLRSLLTGRVDVERLVLKQPLLNLAMDAQGNFNYERLVPTATAPAARKTSKSPAAPIASPIELILRNLAVEHAGIVMRDEARALLLKVEDADLSASFRVTATGAQGKGDARIATINLADLMFVRDVSAPIVMSKETVSLAPIRGQLAGGDVRGDVRVDLKGGLHFTTSLDVTGVAIEKLLKEARSVPAAAGRLKAKASFEGAGGLPTIKGGGQAEIADCKLKDAKVLLLLSRVLSVPEVANPDFDQCLVDFRLASSRLRTPRLRLTGKQIQLTGQGTVNLNTSTLDYDMTLALGRALFNKVTARELRGAFKDRGDGFSTIDFKIYGSTLEPRTDLTTRLAKSAVAGAAQSGLSRLFGRKKE